MIGVQHANIMFISRMISCMGMPKTGKLSRGSFYRYMADCHFAGSAIRDLFLGIEGCLSRVCVYGPPVLKSLCIWYTHVWLFMLGANCSLKTMYLDIESFYVMLVCYE